MRNMQYSAFKKISVLLASSALMATITVAEAAARVTDGATSGNSSGGRDKLSPIVRSCASFDPVTRRSKLIPCDSNVELCQPKATSQRGACSITASSCRGQAETLTGFQTVTWNDGCGSSWNATETCRVSCPYVVREKKCALKFEAWYNKGQWGVGEDNVYLYYGANWNVYSRCSSLRQVFAKKLPYESFFADENCNIISNYSSEQYKICVQYSGSSYQFEVNGSPVSLVWNAAHSVESAYTLTNFPINPKLPAGQKYEWRASAEAPLLVWDPESKRTVTEASQLFGNHTFGKSWKHGYEPLATLDKNSNGKLSGDELKPLALWFDANRNGISEPGEVKGAAESGVVNVYVTPDRTDPKTGWVHASKGFDRMVNGQLETLPSVDWFAKVYKDSGTAIASAALSGTSDTAKPASSQTEIRTPWNTPVGTPNWKDRLDAVQAAKRAAKGGSNSGGGSSSSGASSGIGRSIAPVATVNPVQPLAIAGVWMWTQTPETSSGVDKVADGLLFINDMGDGVIAGSSLFQLPLKQTTNQPGKVMMGIPLRGNFEGKGGSGEEAYRFLVVIPETGKVTDTRAILSADGKTLKGTSSTKTNSGTLEYSWTAIRMPEPEEK